MKSVKAPAILDQARVTIRKIAFEALYGPLAWAYDWVSRTFFLGQWLLWQRTSIRFLRGERILEIGIGTGDVQIALRGAGFQAWGIDLSPQMLRQATRKARRRKLEPFRACRARAQALPFPDAQFDSVVCTFPSEYIIDPQTLSEIRRVLRPGGRLVVVPGGWLTSKDTVGKAFEGVARLVYGYRGQEEANALARRLMEGKGGALWIAALRERMAAAGLRISAHVAHNRRGACLIVVADKT